MRKNLLPMTKKAEITQKDFESLLNWLDEDRDAAVRKYESIYRSLIKIFLARRAYPAEELADRTVDVVLGKIDYLAEEYEGDPRLYFYNVAYKIFQEHLRAPKEESLNEDMSQKEIKAETDLRVECLKECLQALSPEKREIFIKYFQHERQAKIENHKKMAEELGIDINNLRTRVYRIRETLGDCIRKCVQKKIL
jgi:RNA polymerase sigma factor (sigma-70 family)